MGDFWKFCILPGLTYQSKTNTFCVVTDNPARLKLIKRSSLTALGLLLTAYITWRLNHMGVIDADSWQHIEANRSASESQIEKRQFQHIILFQQAGIVLSLLFVPLAMVFHRNRFTLKRHKHNWTRAFKPPIDELKRDLTERLLLKYPHLTTYDLSLSKLLVQGHSSKEIALSLNISPASVNTARYRLRKKLNLNSEVDLVKFLLQIKA